jgi:hypothetical protein
MSHSYFLAVHPIQDYLAPICLVITWAILFVLLASFWTLTSDTVTQAKRMHQIPCAGCQFFTGDYHLKCTVHPAIALSEAAINCPDYRNSSLTLNTDSAYGELAERQAIVRFPSGDVARTASPPRRESLTADPMDRAAKPVSRV